MYRLNESVISPLNTRLPAVPAVGLGPYSLRTLPRIVQPLTRRNSSAHWLWLNAELLLLLLTEAVRRSAA